MPCSQSYRHSKCGYPTWLRLLPWVVYPRNRTMLSPCAGKVLTSSTRKGPTRSSAEDWSPSWLPTPTVGSWLILLRGAKSPSSSFPSASSSLLVGVLTCVSPRLLTTSPSSLLLPVHLSKATTTLHAPNDCYMAKPSQLWYHLQRYPLTSIPRYPNLLLYGYGAFCPTPTTTLCNRWSSLIDATGCDGANHHTKRSSSPSSLPWGTQPLAF